MDSKSLTKLGRRDFIKYSMAGGAVISSGILGFPTIISAKTTIRVGYIPIIDHLAMMVSHAQDNSSFKNLSIEPQLFKSWKSLTGALKGGVIDAALLLSPLAMDVYHKGEGIKTIMVGHRNGSGITVSPQSSIRNAGDLKGKRIAIPAKISTHTAILDHYLRTAGLSLKDVKTRAVAPPDMIKSLARGGIDAFIVADPFVSLAEERGVGKTLTLSKDIIPNHICCVVVAQKKSLRENPEGIKEWVHSMQKGGMFIDKDKAKNGGKKTAEIAAKYTPHKPQIIANSLLNPSDRIMFNSLKPQKKDFQTILEISQKAGILPSIDLNDFIDSSFAF